MTPSIRCGPDRRHPRLPALSSDDPIAAYHAATRRFTDGLADARARAAGHAVGAAIVAVIDKVDAHGADWRKAVPDMQLKLAEDPASFERAFDVPVRRWDSCTCRNSTKPS